jgi:hypothetical protein
MTDDLNTPEAPNPEELNNPEISVPEELIHQVAITSIDKLYNWGRRSSIWPVDMTFLALVWRSCDPALDKPTS